MATRKPLVRIAGKNQQLPAADSLDVPGSRFHEGPTEPTIKSYGDRWLQDTTGIEYTWVDPGVWVDLNEATAADVAASIHAATSKTTPIDTDELGIADSAASYVLKKLTWANLKATLLAYFKGQFREKLTAARTYYVRTDGSDSNDGLANTSGGAFLTIQKAIDTATALDNGGFDITITVGAGTFAARNYLKTIIGSGRILIGGAGDTTIIAPGVAGPCFGDSSSSGWLGVYDITSMKLAPTVAGCWGFGSVYGQGGILLFGSINFAFGAVGGVNIQVGRGGFVGNANRNYTISAGATQHMAVYDCGHIRTQACTVTLTGTPAFSNYFAVAQRGGIILANGNTYSGSATGQRFVASQGGGILVSGAGTSYFPGNSGSTATTPGWYE